MPKLTEKELQDIIKAPQSDIVVRLLEHIEALESEARGMLWIKDAAVNKMASMMRENESAGSLDNWMTPADRDLYEAINAAKTREG